VVFPVAAAIAYGAIAGGGLAAAGASLQRLWRYLTADAAEQEAQDERLTPLVSGIAEALSRAKFGMSLITLAPNERRVVEAEARTDTVILPKQLNEASKERYGKAFSRLRKAEKEELLRWLSEQY